MPAYDFRCPECDIVVEVTRRAGDVAPEPCPECGGLTKRIFSPVGVVFKGSGFHNTDYRKKPAEVPSKKDAPAACDAKKDSPSCASCPASSDSNAD